ncbi:MAG: archaeal proteasome endopeptidase complex subunit alpha, partial [Promethearchaeota archaeon]
YDELISVEEVTREICDLKQLYTQNAGVRPFGVSLLIGGLDPTNELKLFITDPSGAFWAYHAYAIGSYEQEVREFLEKNYKTNITLKEAKLLSIKALLSVVEDEIEKEKIDMVEITKKDKGVRFIPDKELDSLLNSKEIKAFLKDKENSG